MTSEDISWTGSNGRDFVGYLATPEKPNGGAVVIAHNLSGLSDTEREIARRMAKLGYVALAADYIGEGYILKEAEFYPFVEANTADPTHIRASLTGAYEILKKHQSVFADRIAVVGYCYGGQVAIEFARTGADVKAVVGLHTTLPILRGDENRAIKGRVLILNAASDRYIPWSDRIVFEAQMDAAGVDWDMMLFGSTPHGFTGRDAATASHGMPGIGYSERSDKRSWKLMTDMLAETIGER